MPLCPNACRQPNARRMLALLMISVLSLGVVAGGVGAGAARAQQGLPQTAEGVTWAADPAAVASGRDPQAPEHPAFIRALAEAAASDPVIADFYAARHFAPIWTGPADAARRGALLQALGQAPDHALPPARYDAAGLAQALRRAVTEGDRGRVEVAMTRAYLAWAHDLRGGLLDPARVDSGIVREIARPDPALLLAAIASGDPVSTLHGLLPASAEYSRLMRARFELSRALEADAWGPDLAAGAVKPGAKPAAIVALRDRLAAMGYLGAGSSASYDARLRQAVQRFQADHGLRATGIADTDTVAEINIGPEARLQSVIVAMERLRWMGDAPLGARHIWVNLPEMVAKIVDNGQVVFQTRAVIGKDVPDQRTPEFSDQMQYMVVNPSWSVPRSITTKEYLPLLQRNPNAVSHLQVVDRNGRVVPRSAVNFAAYSARSFPYALRQPPSDGNALGKVKFMFPNKYNIYLHDTPSKSLFDNQVRAYSHGCIRLSEPFDFAYALLARQTDDPQGEFQSHLDSDRESRLNLAADVPVHLVYFTAWPTAKGRISWRPDVYGRDAAIFAALRAAGVATRALQN